MNIYNSPVTKIAFWVIVIGGACLLIPLFAPLLPLQYLKGYGEIGDVLGGISSPFLQILGSVLLFLVLKAQIDANGILHQQIEKEYTKEQLRHELNQLHELYMFVERNIKIFSVHDKFHRTLILSGFCLLKIAKISLNSSFSQNQLNAESPFEHSLNHSEINSLRVVHASLFLLQLL